MSSAVQLATGVKWTEIAQAVAVLTAGAFAIWRWGFEEYRRRKAEIPTLDGAFACADIIQKNDRCFVSLVSTWSNKGSLPVFASPTLSRLTIHDVTDQDAGAKGGFLALDAAGDQPNIDRAPFGTFHWYMFEPGTDSQIILPLVLPCGRVWLAKVLICLDEAKYRGKRGEVLSFTRTLLFST